MHSSVLNHFPSQKRLALYPISGFHPDINSPTRPLLPDSLPLNSPHMPLSPTNPDTTNVEVVSFVEFNPNDVKHRKRTSPHQQRVLEAVFEHTTKPDGQKRKELARQLTMSPRSVQVWFQNRRAKEKKGTRGHRQTPSPTIRPSSSPSSDESATMDDSSRSPQPPSSHSPADLTGGGQSSPATSPPQLTSPSQNDSDPTFFLLKTSPSVSPGSLSPSTTPDPHLNYRRGSLPTFVRTSNSSLPDIIEPSLRRRSVDATLRRLGSHPYAELAKARNSVYYDNIQASLIRARAQHALNNTLPDGQGYVDRPGLLHRASMPQVLVPNHLHERSSVDVNVHLSEANRAASFPSVLEINTRQSFLLRTVPSPIPGPLPSPGYSFGAASSDPDTEDDVTSYATSYDWHSRSGSLVSNGGSESSATSAYFSDASCPPEPDLAGGHDTTARRGARPSDPFLDMSTLDLGGQSGHPPQATENGYYSSQESLPQPPPSSRSQDGEVDLCPSPSSTASPRHSPPSDQYQACSSSELQYALQSDHELSTGSRTTDAISAAGPQQAPFDYGQTISNPLSSLYPHQISPSSASSLALPVFSEVPSEYKYTTGVAQISRTGHYLPVPQTDMRRQSFSSDEQDIIELHHAMEPACGAHAFAGYSAVNLGAAGGALTYPNPPYP